MCSLTDGAGAEEQGGRWGLTGTGPWDVGFARASLGNPPVGLASCSATKEF